MRIILLLLRRIAISVYALDGVRKQKKRTFLQLRIESMRLHDGQVFTFRRIEICLTLRFRRSYIVLSMDT